MGRAQNGNAGISRVVALAATAWLVQLDDTIHGYYVSKNKAEADAIKVAARQNRYECQVWDKDTAVRLY